MRPFTHRRRMRIVGYDQAEAFCYGCHDWYPITLEFWPSRTHFGSCRACDRERSRLYETRRRLDPEHRLRQIQKSRDYRAYLAAHAPELVAVEKREQRFAYNAEQNRRRAKERAA